MSKKTKQAIKQDKIANDVRIASIQCKCSNRVPIKSFERYDGDYGVCNWCGNRVYKDKQTEFRYKLKEMRRTSERAS